MASSLNTYAQKKKEYLKTNPECEAHFCNCNTPTEHLTIHHKMGRVGYASGIKREQGVPLLQDADYFLAVCVSAHRWIEDNPAKAKVRAVTFLCYGRSLLAVPAAELVWTAQPFSRISRASGGTTTAAHRQTIFAKSYRSLER